MQRGLAPVFVSHSSTYVSRTTATSMNRTLASAGVTLVPSTSDEDEESFSMPFIVGQHLVED